MFETNIIYIIQDMNFLFNKLPYSLIDIDSLSSREELANRLMNNSAKNL